MKTIIAVWGKSNSGKTSTINEVSRMLCDDYSFSAEQVAEVDDTGYDLYQILTKDGIKIGIISQGDIAEYLKERLAKLVREGCVLILCSTRTRGGTCDAVNEYKGQWEIEWVEIGWTPKEPSNPIKEAKVNEIMAIIKKRNIL